MDIIESFDALTVGQEFDFGSLVMTREEILDFGHRFDPQPMHVDEAAAAAGPFGGLIASGLHTLSACFSLMIRTGVIAKTSLGGAGMEVAWPAPVRPGDVLQVTGRVEQLTPSRSKPDRGIAKLRFTGTRRGDAVVVLDVLTTVILRR
ncbi:MaoC/PaaZ C-terminal domain-containing protein [Paeniroseomonas aquatica]|uniref:MaoC/PaaZ C-terminal domain-containing protein n=1 Tax=Paeniroseomonas aquatica TaxID=373043 RepID=A0ABT8A881_9PROT|nr:MaoC/PaaZ C-terminal domain-containing protein [Paeniroseomonas aquatica]MDN3565739.1 MaoC/PaaZ C-terminal domain-containing protein [Paeniroseomonas aquatica]